MKSDIKVLKDGGVTSAQGFVAAGISAGIKPDSKKDMALVYSVNPAQVGATFTTNLVKAAPVKVSMTHARNGTVRGVILNSGNANACTGVRGIKNARTMVEETAEALDCKPKEILVCSTGRIGVQLPMNKIGRGIKKAVSKLDIDGGVEAAKAIMTSDTFRKEYAVRVEIDGRKVTIGGIAKGAGMIHPQMATMLSVITTDVAIDKIALRKCVYNAVEQSFNRISVDGDTSTNDTVIVLANSMAQNPVLKSYSPQLDLFQRALTTVMRHLSRMIVKDGEGVSRMVEVIVKGAASFADAKAAALAVAHSPLVKCSWCGGDPNWGRLMDAIGYSGARIKEEMVEIYYDGVLAVANGEASRTPVARLRKAVSKPAFTITIHLHTGTGEYSVLTTDLTEKYVEFNKGE
jgi:glutamate N-acetyltransferase / amino-acid N-acetyltransferase